MNNMCHIIYNGSFCNEIATFWQNQKSYIFLIKHDMHKNNGFTRRNRQMVYPLLINSYNKKYH